MFTLSGGHVFPLYDAAVHADPPMRLLDVRHEQTAVFAAEATAQLTRKPGLAVLTAGPGVTNSVSAVTTAHFNGSPVVVLGGRAPDYRWGAGSLQEIDHPPLLAPVTKRAWTEHATAQVAASVDEAFRLAAAPHRGPVFLDLSLEALYGKAEVAPLAAVARRSAGARRAGPRGDQPGSPGCSPRPSGRSWCSAPTSGWTAPRPPPGPPRSSSQLPVIANGQGRGILPAGHPLLVTRARSAAFGEADLVIVAGTPLDFRLGYGQFGGRASTPPGSCTSPTPRAARDALPAGRDGLRRPDRVLHRAGRGSWPRAPAPAAGRTADWLPRGLARLQDDRAGRDRRGRRAAGQRRPARSTRCASTAS